MRKGSSGEAGAMALELGISRGPEGRAHAVWRIAQRALADLVCWGIVVYQRFLSPLLGSHCRYSPTCSQYTLEAVRSHGPWVGIGMGALRLGRCNVFFRGGHDPVQPLRGARRKSRRNVACQD